MSRWPVSRKRDFLKKPSIALRPDYPGIWLFTGSAKVGTGQFEKLLGPDSKSIIEWALWLN